jgi:hypothetical protein
MEPLSLLPESERERLRRIAADLEGTPAGFPAWLSDNFEVWREFAGLADTLRIKHRRKNWSARAALHVLRWQRATRETPDEGFKINNKWSAPMARLYNAIHGFEFFRERESCQ